MSRDDVRIAGELIQQEGYIWRHEVYKSEHQCEAKYVFGYKCFGNPEYHQDVALSLNVLASKLAKIINDHNVTFMNYPRDEVGMGITRSRPLSADEMGSLCALLSRESDSRHGARAS